MSDPSQRLTAALADRYRIERELGRGGMATVFLAEDLKHHRLVAIKVLDPEVAAAVGPERFLREIEIAARLEHPHILPLFDSGQADGLLYYAMPYVDGESLRDRLKREKQLPVDDVLRIAAELADGLGHAHAQGIVHRDVKPENVLFAGGHALLADFGIARALGAAGPEKLTQTGVTVGTPTYMSPEQAAGQAEVDTRSDQYALGCVVYEMLAGQPPFTGPTAESIAHQHLSVQPHPVTELRPTVSQAMAAAITRALAKSPADRYADVGGFTAALAEGVQAPSRATRGWRRRAALAVAGGVLMLGAVATWQAWWPFGRDAAPPGKKGWILVAEFEGPRDDPDVARAAQGLTAAALDQSGIVMTVPRDQLATALAQAGRPDTLRVDGPLARELAYRNGIRSVLEGRVSRVGKGYSVVLRLADSSNDSTLFTVSGSARNGDALIPAIDQLARRMRRELGENRSAVRATRGLFTIITPSFEAYRKVEQGVAIWSKYADAAGGMRLLREALELDPDCATAYLEMVTLFGIGNKPDSAVWACDQALKRPRRLTEEQRLFVEADRCFATANFECAWQTLTRQLRLFPDGPCAGDAYNRRSLVNSYLRRWDEALADARRSNASSPFVADVNGWNIQARFERQTGRLDEAEKTISHLPSTWRFPAAVQCAVARENWARAESLCLNPPPEIARLPRVHYFAAFVGSVIQARRGEVRAAREASDPRTAVFLALVSGTTVPVPEPGLAGDTTTWAVITRGWHAALAEDLPAARHELAVLKGRSPYEQASAGAAGAFLEASIAAAENRWSDVIRLIGSVALRGDDLGLPIWRRIGPTPERWLVAEAYEHLGLPDSAAVAFERVLEPPESREIVFFPPYAHQRLVMIYARMGKQEEAERHWQAFSAAFTNPDPEVRHLLDEARVAIQGLRGMGRPERPGA